jgi:hypothetical protein
LRSAGENDADLLFHGQRLVLGLLEDFHQAGAAGKLGLGSGIEIGTETGEGGQFAILGEIEAQGTGNLLHRLDLGGATDPRNRETDVDGGPHPGEEEVGLEINLAVGNGNNVGGNIGGNVAGLGLDDRQGGQEPAPSSSESLEDRSSRREWLKKMSPG